MKKYEVEITLTRRVTIDVTALSAADAKRIVEEYGLLEACGDYPFSTDEVASEKITGVRKKED